jgi:hypothetical protein
MSTVSKTSLKLQINFKTKKIIPKNENLKFVDGYWKITFPKSFEKFKK